jgi:parvulin-like peptidyl-prolyl isomerase
MSTIVSRFRERASLGAAMLLACSIGGLGPVARAQDVDPPAQDIAAEVNGEPITLQELEAAIKEASQAGDPTSAQSRQQVLERLINIRLILQEAREIGLDEIPELREMVEAHGRVTLREHLLESVVQDVVIPEETLEASYRQAVQEWKLVSLLFAKEEDAKSFEEAIRAGGSFAELGNAAIEAGSASGSLQATVMKPDELLPEVAEAVSKIAPGESSSVLQIPVGFVVLRLEEIQYPENPEIRERVRGEVLHDQQIRKLQELHAEIASRHAKVDRAFLDGLDLEAKEPGFDALLDDSRVLAEIEGEAPLTVADLAKALKMEFYHGIAGAIETKKVNARKEQIFSELLMKRVLRKEALARGLDKTEAYLSTVQEYEDSLIFGAFVRKVVSPEVKIDEAEVRAYYQEHIADFSSPERVRTDCLVFKNARDAQSALEQLQKGAEMSWVKANAEGQLGRETPGLLACPGNLALTNELPEGIRKALFAASLGDHRMYTSPEEHVYVFQVLEHVPAQPKPFESVLQTVASAVFDRKLKSAIEEWAQQIRLASQVTIHSAETR